MSLESMFCMHSIEATDDTVAIGLSESHKNDRWTCRHITATSENRANS